MRRVAARAASHQGGARERREARRSRHYGKHRQQSDGGWQGNRALPRTCPACHSDRARGVPAAALQAWRKHPLSRAPASSPGPPSPRIRSPSSARCQEAINFSSFDFLDLLNETSIKDECECTIRKYGVGSCGPRGFYGTIDVHLKLEEDLARFVGTEAGIIYSYDAATASSIIPAFLKRGDLIIRDEAINVAMQAGQGSLHPCAWGRGGGREGGGCGSGVQELRFGSRV
jgi:hypothetical protein